MAIIQIYQIRHQHIGVLYGKSFIIPPSEAEMAEACKRFPTGWIKAHPVEMIVPDTIAEYFDKPPVVEVVESGVAFPDVIIRGTAKIG